MDPELAQMLGMQSPSPSITSIVLTCLCVVQVVSYMENNYAQYSKLLPDGWAFVLFGIYACYRVENNLVEADEDAEYEEIRRKALARIPDRNARKDDDFAFSILKARTVSVDAEGLMELQ